MIQKAHTSNNGRPLRVLLAPQEIGMGQLQLLAEALRRKGHYATAVNYYADSRRSNDVNLGLVSGRRTPVRAAKVLSFAANAVRNYDVFHFFFGESLLPGYWDLPVLKRLGKKVFVHFRGSDVRQRKYLNEVMERRVQGMPVMAKTPLSSSSQLRRIRTWRKYADSIFVSIPELLQVIPEATVIPQTIDLSRWPYCPEAPNSLREEVVIAHATSDRAIKGTKYVIDAVDSLKSRGYPVRLLVIEKTPHEQVKDLYRTCHIGVDELLQGSYGNVSIELMALGKPVVAYLDPWYTHQRPDLPIVNATPTDLAERLQMLMKDQRLRIELGQRGRQYVERWHDVDRVVDQLLQIYLSHRNGATHVHPGHRN